MREHTPDPEKDALGPQDEEMIKDGIHRAETSGDTSSLHSASTSSYQEPAINSTTFTPTRTFYIQRHNLFSKTVSTLDITPHVPVPYTGGEITPAFLAACRTLTDSKPLASNPVYSLTKPHWYNRSKTMYAPTSTTPETELATWKQGPMSFSAATLSFPPHSPHCSTPLSMAPKKWYRRTNVFVQDSVPYTYKCDSKLKANRMTLLKSVGGEQVVVARYAQRWGSWITGGVLLVDASEVDEVVSVLATCVMLHRMQQRAAERARGGAGGAGGGSG